MKRFSILFTIVITLTSTCILLAACRAKKEVAETNLSESAATVNSTATGNTPLTSSVAVQPDTNYWQLVYPKTAKTEGNLWRKGNVYTTDTNNYIYYEVKDTSSVTIHISGLYGSFSENGKEFYNISGGDNYPRPSNMSFLSFLQHAENRKEITSIFFHFNMVKEKDTSNKVHVELYKTKEQYYGLFFDRYWQYWIIENNWIYVYYKNKSFKEKIKVPDRLSLTEFVDSLIKCNDIDSICFIIDEGQFDKNFDEVINSLQTDSDRSEQWGLERIYVQDAWDITMGDSNLVVTVLELDGVDWSHYELGKGYDNYQNIYVNSGEDAWHDTTLSGRKTYNPRSGNGLDEDMDSLIDNYIGWNFKDNNNDCRTDSCHHGTKVAGIIAAKTNNGRGISGITGGDSCSGVRILPYAARSAKIVNALGDADEKGARVVNMSIGTAHTSPKDSILQVVNSHGVILIAASGNNDKSDTSLNVRYPAANTNVIAVGAIDKNNIRRLSSCYGQELSVVAPGVNIYTTTQNDTFINASGTSFAAPHVTGVAALMLSVNPNLTPADVRRIIEKTARKVGGYDYRNDPQHPNGTWNEEMGYGLVDAHAAVLNVVDSTLDLYVRDSENDNGDEPSVTTTPWNSPDIWIEDTKGKEVSSLKGLWEYNVCVRIHNRTDSASTGYEKLYLNWVKAGPSSDWSAAWQGKKILTGDGTSVSLGNPIIGEKNRKGHPIPVIPAGRDTVVKVLWTTPEPDYYSAFYNGSELRHFCLCARIHDGRRIGNEDADSINMGEFVKNSSHVAWKNIIIMEAGIQKAPLHVYSTSAKPICLRYAGCANTAGEQLHEYAEIKLKLDTGLYNVWQRGGFTGGGFVLQADSSLLLQSANAELCSLLLDTNRIYLMQTSVQFNNRLVPQNSTFHADIVQYYEYDENGIHVSELVGGEHYKAVRSGDCEYTVQIAGDTDLLQGETATFTATGAESYRWYNAGGDLLGTAETMTAVPAYSQCYYLETTGGLCGYISRDTVCVHVSEGEIVTLYPNPTNDFVHLEYQITGNYNNASIQITNELGTTQQTVTLNEPQGSVTLDVQGLPAGAYYVLLKSPSGKVLDIKTMVKGE